MTNTTPKCLASEFTTTQAFEDTLKPIHPWFTKSSLAHMYRKFRQMRGAGSPGITDASTTIDETLYGDDPTQEEER